MSEASDKARLSQLSGVIAVMAHACLEQEDELTPENQTRLDKLNALFEARPDVQANYLNITFEILDQIIEHSEQAMKKFNESLTEPQADTENRPPAQILKRKEKSLIILPGQ